MARSTTPGPYPALVARPRGTCDAISSMRSLLVLALSVAGCSQSDAPSATSSSKPGTSGVAHASPSTAKDPAAARARIQGGAVVVDVRSPGEFAEGHLPDAINIPVGELASRIADVDRLVAGDRGKPVVVYCATGRRSGKAKQALDAAGFSQVVNGGGFDDLR